MKQKVLEWCRSNGVGYIMRTNNFRCMVVNINSTEPIPGGEPWETRPRTEAEGRDWHEVAEKLGLS